MEVNPDTDFREGISDEELLDSIDKLMDDDIIQEVQNAEEEEYRFDHKLIRSVIYDSMSKSHKRNKEET